MITGTATVAIEGTIDYGTEETPTEDEDSVDLGEEGEDEADGGDDMDEGETAPTTTAATTTQEAGEETTTMPMDLAEEDGGGEERELGEGDHQVCVIYTITQKQSNGIFCSR